MASLIIRISDSFIRDVKRRAAGCGFESVEAYVATLAEQDTADHTNLQELLSRRATAKDAGEMGSHDFDAIRTKVRAASL